MSRNVQTNDRQAHRSPDGSDKKDPIPLDDSDIDPGINIVREFDPDQIPERGYLHWFYHSELTPLPVRDVTNTQGEGHKPEPCIERKAENYCDECYQDNVNSFADQERRYLFLYTTCRYDGIEACGDRFIVGYIVKQRKLSIDGRTAVQGPMKLVRFRDACPLDEVAPPNLRGAKKLDREATRRVLEFLDPAINIYEDCLSAIEELELSVQRKRLWEKPLAGNAPRSDCGSRDSHGC